MGKHEKKENINDNLERRAGKSSGAADFGTDESLSFFDDLSLDSHLFTSEEPEAETPVLRRSERTPEQKLSPERESTAGSLELPDLPKITPVVPRPAPAAPKTAPAAPKAAPAPARTAPAAPKAAPSAPKPAAARPQRPAAPSAPVSANRSRPAAPAPERTSAPVRKAPVKKNPIVLPPEEYDDEEEDITPKKKGGFRKALRVYIIILAAVFLAALVVLWVLLTGFQKKKDAENAAAEIEAAEIKAEAAHKEAVRRAPQLAFEAWEENADADYWTDLWYALYPQDISGRDRVHAFMEEAFGGEGIEPFRAMEYTDAAPVYVLRQGEKTLARIRLTGADTEWTVSDVELLVKGEESASVRVAVGSKVYCNGVELGEEYAGEAKQNFTYEPLMDSLVNPVSWTTYTVDGLLTAPELTVTPPNGCSVTETAEGDFLLCLAEAEAQPYVTKAVNFTKAYLFYYLSGLNGTWGNLYNALAYLNPNSPAYKDLNDTYNGVVWNSAHTDINTSNTSASGVVIWADNCYSVDVTYDATGTVQGQLDEYAATMRVYFTDDGNGFTITHFETL